MPQHNGDFSEEAEYKRALKREKMQRRRIRERIREGRATPEEIAAIEAFEEGYAWELPTYEEPVASPSVRPARAQEPEESEEYEGGNGWIWALAIGGAAILAGLGAIWRAGKNS